MSFPSPMSTLLRRQDYPSCTNVGNDVLSCYPTSDVTISQGSWSRFVWNSRFPGFLAQSAVDVYLRHADSDNPVLSWTDIPNAQGSLAISPNDTWWPTETAWSAGSSLTWTYYFIVVPANTTLTGGEEHQPVFSVVQTTPPPSLSASVASIEELSSSLSEIASQLSSATTSPTGLQSNQQEHDVPRWAIAVICVLGFFLLMVSLAILFLVLRGHRRTKTAGTLQSEKAANSEPVQPEQHGLLYAGDEARPSISQEITHTHVAEAFRDAMRRPQFTATDSNGNSQDASPIMSTFDPPPEHRTKEIEAAAAERMDRELAREGTRIKQVGDLKKPEVHHADDGLV